MAYVDAVARVQQIQATITQLNTRANAASAAAFSTALSAAAPTATATASPAASSALSTFSAPAVGALGDTTTAAAGGVSGDDIVEAAKKYIGVPYVFGGEDSSGMDCSGLVQRTLADLGIDAPRLASQQQNIGTEVPSLDEAKPGDLIVTRNADHIVIYAGNNQIVHAPYPGRTVSLQDNYLSQSEIQTIRRVTVPEPAAPTVTASSVALAQSAELSAILQQITGSSAIGTSSTGMSTTEKVADLMAAAQMTMITGTPA